MTATFMRSLALFAAFSVLTLAEPGCWSCACESI